MVQKRAHTKRTTSTEAAGNLTEREKGSFCFLIINVSYNARYAKLREVKKPISRIFVVSASAGSFLGLVQPFYVVCSFYHILLFYLSHAYRLFLCYALLHRFVCNSFIPVSIYAPLYNISCCVYSLRLWLFICFCVDIALRVSIRSFLWMLLYVWLLTAYNANYKDL